MANYSSYETGDEIAAGPRTAVFSARKQGDASGAVYAVKVLSHDPGPVPDGAGEGATVSPAVLKASFEKAATLQQQASAVSPHVAPVVASGKGDRESWCVTPLYPRSLQKIVQGRVALNKPALFHIVRSMLRGLLAFKQAASRSHGNLKPSNVFLGVGAKLTQVEVVLSDPSGDSSGETSRHELADLRSLGLLIYQMVRRREVAEGADWLILPLDRTPEWEAVFGREADQWLRLCNILLDPHLTLGLYSLEKLEQDLARLQPKPPVSPRLVAGVAGVALLGVAGALFLGARGKYTAVYLTADPQPAQVTLTDSNAQPVFGPQRLPQAAYRLRLLPGDYRVLAEYGDLDPLRTNLTVRRGVTTNLPLRLAYGSVRIQSQPPGARVNDIDGKIIKLPDGQDAITPCVIPYVKPDSVRYELDLEKYATTNVTGTVRAGGETALNATLSPTRPGEVQVTFILIPTSLVVTDAEGKELRGRKNLEPGHYTVSVKHKDLPWPALSREFDVREGQAEPIQILYPNAPVSLKSSSPEQAEVWVGTNLVATTPQEIYWPTGRVEFRFAARGFKDRVEERFLADQQAMEVAVALEAEFGSALVRTDLAVVLSTNGIRYGPLAPDTPVSINFFPGTYQLTARPDRTNFPTRTVAVKVGLGEAINVVYQFLGQVKLTSDPPGAEAQDPITGEWVGVGTISRLPLGTNSLRARHRPEWSLAEVAGQVAVTRQGIASNLFQFRYGTVVIRKAPPEASVSLTWQGRMMGRLGAGPTSYTHFPVPVGPVTYRVVRDDQAGRPERQLTAEVLYKSTTNLVADFGIAQTYTNSLNMVFVWFEPGQYYVSRFETTQGQYEAIRGAATRAGVSPNQPVTVVSWKDANDFCELLNARPAELARLAEASIAMRYRLPREQEWASFASRDGDALTEAVFSSSRPADIDPGRKSNNRLGLYDLFGNVAEWCQGQNGQPVGMGGSYPNDKSWLTDQDPFLRYDADATTASQGNQDLGFRCILAKP